MKRLELFEFEDFHWLPGTIRSGITNLIQVLHRLTGTSKVLAQLILKIKSKYDFEQIVDMGSGSGGAMPDTIRLVNESVPGGDIKLVLTDYYPNSEAVRAINARQSSVISYQETSLDARQLETAPPGLKTMVASFHHMSPTVAREMLQSAQKNKQPLLIYEIAKNNVPVLVWCLLLPLSLVILILMSLVLTLFVRPMTLSQLFFTYLIPVIPLIYAWDGQASLMRTYTFKDVEKLLGASMDSEDYVWEIEDASTIDGKQAKGYYIMGYPNINS